MTFSELGKDSKREDKDRMESAQGFVVEGEDEGREEGYSCPVVSCPTYRASALEQDVEVAGASEAIA